MAKWAKEGVVSLRRRITIEACEMHVGRWVSSRELFETIPMKSRMFFRSLQKFTHFYKATAKPKIQRNKYGGILLFVERWWA